MSLRILALTAACLTLLTAGHARAQAVDCTGDANAGGQAWADAANVNASSLTTLSWTPFNQVETGWEAYVPALQHEIGVRCDPGGAAFAAGLAAFQSRHGLPATGVFDGATFNVLKGLLQERRPFIMARVRNECPDPPPLNQLGYLSPEEEHADRMTRLLRRDVLEAYRRMAAAARAEVHEIAANPELLQIFSAFRDPEADAARCAQQGNCDGVRRAVCSSHRTGTAIDLYVGHAPGMEVDSTAPDSRLFMSKSPAYQWLVMNAGRFGFRPYLYEPWHWEYVEAVR